MTANRPSIFQIGKVRDDGESITVRGWGLGLCAARCPCHRVGPGGSLALAEDQDAGLLGLVSNRWDDCCEPWTAAELAAILTDFAAIAALETEGSA